MAILPGLRLGPYETLSVIDVGGMGEVNRARAKGLHLIAERYCRTIKIGTSS